MQQITELKCVVLNFNSKIFIYYLILLGCLWLIKLYSLNYIILAYIICIACLPHQVKFPSINIYITWFSEIEEGRGSKIEKSIETSMWEHDMDGLPFHTPYPGIEPSCALIQNQTSKLLVQGLMPNQLSHMIQGTIYFN